MQGMNKITAGKKFLLLVMTYELECYCSKISRPWPPIHRKTLKMKLYRECSDDTNDFNLVRWQLI